MREGDIRDELCPVFCDRPDVAAVRASGNSSRPRCLAKGCKQARARVASFGGSGLNPQVDTTLRNKVDGLLLFLLWTQQLLRRFARGWPSWRP